MHAVWSAGAGLPYLEPAFATVAQAPGREVHGLACAVTAQQWARIQLTEAGYDAVEVRCEGYGGSRALLARTLVFPAQRRRKGLRPSRRYAACPLSLASRLYRASLRQETAHSLSLCDGTPGAEGLVDDDVELPERESASGPGGLTREVETPLPSNSPHGHMILRGDRVWAHTGGGNALAFEQPTCPYDIESGPGGLTREVETPLPSNHCSS
jgi:hypothetical protein